jgi:hypothetical protein
MTILITEKTKIDIDYEYFRLLFLSLGKMINLLNMAKENPIFEDILMSATDNFLRDFCVLAEKIGYKK